MLALRHPQVLDLVHLKVRRGGPVLPAAQRVHGDRAAEWAGALAVQPQAEALLTEHVLRGQRPHGHRGKPNSLAPPSPAGAVVGPQRLAP